MMLHDSPMICLGQPIHPHPSPPPLGAAAAAARRGDSRKRHRPWCPGGGRVEAPRRLRDVLSMLNMIINGLAYSLMMGD